jgi:hypothetical protein
VSLLTARCVRDLLLDLCQGWLFASKVVLTQRLPEMDIFGVCLPFLIQFLFEFGLFHSCISVLLDMVQYKVLTASGEFQVFPITLGLQPYIHKVCNSYFLYY